MTTSDRGDAGAGFRAFRWPDLEGEFATSVGGQDPEPAIRHILDPASAVTTIHWGRNYIYESSMPTPGGPRSVVVKQFRNHGWRRALDRRMRGSKATRSWHIAKALIEAGLPTPEPMVVAESTEAQGNSHYVAELLKPAYEVRQFFRGLQNQPDAGQFPEVDEMEFLHRLGALARSLHDAGIWYRDLSLGNVLAHPNGDGTLELYLVDFNTAQSKKRLGLWRRSRDICRFPIVERHHREAYLKGYWSEVPSRWSPRWWLYTASVRGYILKHQIKNTLRGQGTTAKAAQGGKHHAHIPAAGEGVSIRDQAVWDRLSDQPHQHASKWQKTKIRMADAPDHLADFAAVLGAAPKVLSRYRELKAGLWQESIPFQGLGVAVRPCPEDPEAHFEALKGLGVGHVLLRLHPWDNDHEAEQALAQRLNDAGIEVAFSLPQNRELVTDLPRWERAVEALAQTFTQYGRHFIIGHAINRSKWGVWTSREYGSLLKAAAEILGGYPEVEILGPGVIDFEFQATLAALQRKKPGVHFDAIASLLYVDRRGAPENPQMGLNTVGKVTLLKAICDTARYASPRSWITEVNWPLWEGPHSPAGRSVSVDEESQADYLTRYYVLALTTGMVERIYWWRLAARGYGLSTFEPDGALRLRPSYHALKTLIGRLHGATSLGPIESPEGTYVFRFERNGGQRLVAWALEPGATVELPSKPQSAVDRDGAVIDIPASSSVVVGPSPVFFEM
ncbi:MAG: lipopolysaccharide kinase InaA family protein [Acidobacteriota bacterium]